MAFTTQVKDTQFYLCNHIYICNCLQDSRQPCRKSLKRTATKWVGKVPLQCNAQSTANYRSAGSNEQQQQTNWERWVKMWSSLQLLFSFIIVYSLSGHWAIKAMHLFKIGDRYRANFVFYAYTYVRQSKWFICPNHKSFHFVVIPKLMLEKGSVHI